MLFNYIKIAFRNILRHKVYSIINILGLAIGMACAILLLLFVREEISYGKHNSKYKRIYQVQVKTTMRGREDYTHFTPLPLAQILKDEYPGIEECIRIASASKIDFIDQNGEDIREENICYADPSIFKVFDHKFIYGSPEGALDSPNTMVLSETLAKKYFGEQDPVGKSLSRKDGIAYIVKGVFEDLPRNSSNSYTALITSNNLSEIYGAELYAMLSNSFTSMSGDTKTFILLAENARLSDIISDSKRFSEKYIPQSTDDDEVHSYVFQSLANSYLHSYPWPNSHFNMLQRVYIISALALFILIIACINYMNLSTARATGRAREVGVRKVLGANRASLIRQFLCESIIITFIAMLIALVLIELAIPSFNNLIGKQLSFSATGKTGFFSGLLMVTVFVGLVAGSYPAFVLSSFLPVKVFSGSSRSGADKGMFRKILVVIQYSLSVIMIVCTILLMKQMSYVRNMDLGFNKQDVFIGRPTDFADFSLMTVFKQDLLKYSGISSAALSDVTVLGSGSMITIFQIEDSNGDLIQKDAAFLSADFDYIGLMELQVLEGRSFNAEIESDRTQAVMVNEALVKEMGWADSPIGKHIAFASGPDAFGSQLKVIGVLKDFYYRMEGRKIQPTIITQFNPVTAPMPKLSIKIKPTDQAKTIKFIKEKWLEMNPNEPLELSSLEDLINSKYLIVEAAIRIFMYSAFLGIFISCLGLFGLSSFTAENKTKEIGVRKVFGASVWSIVSGLSISFIKLVLIASIIACPIAYFAMSMWLENFAYKTEMPWWLFVGAICLALLIALVTVSYHAVKAALTDPVKALRYE